ncbi:MAG: response regulator [Deltaproteobacteria bacterium]|nr:response regulator [Deltaproteobacteria bacterium]
MARVLLVDDEVAFVDTLAKLLRRRGVDVTVAYDGDAALAEVARSEFDVVVLDQRMPGRDGIQTLEEIRRRDAGMPVLLLSGHADLPRVTEALRLGACDYLLKPCAAESLLAAIEEACERRAIHRELAAPGTGGRGAGPGGSTPP